MVGQIHAVNHGWKLAQDLFGPESPIAKGLRDQKSVLQARLLRTHPDSVALELDPRIEGQETYGLRLQVPCGPWQDAAHMPAAYAQRHLNEFVVERVIPKAPSNEAL